ncbi:MAG: alpha/beta hydrolase [Myxococcales bacterium]|jgi:pimeloyl-ACP methyl ester carboxylesterase
MELEQPTPTIVSVLDRGQQDGFRSLTLRTARGPVEMRLYEAKEPLAAVILVGGVGGGFDSPAHNLYAALGGELPELGITVLRLRYRNPTDLDEAVYDVRAGIRMLAGRGFSRIGLVGHSFGGAVVISAAARAPEVATVVTLATQSYGTEWVDQLPPRPILLVHGTEDEVLPPASSRLTFKRAAQPKQLYLIDGAGHLLDEVAEEVHGAVRDWLTTYLLGRLV